MKITEKQYKEAKKIVEGYIKQQLNRPFSELSLSELKQRYNKSYDDMIRYKKEKMMVYYQTERNKVAKLGEEIDRRKVK